MKQNNCHFSLRVKQRNLNQLKKQNGKSYNKKIKKRRIKSTTKTNEIHTVYAHSVALTVIDMSIVNYLLD